MHLLTKQFIYFESCETEITEYLNMQLFLSENNINALHMQTFEMSEPEIYFIGLTSFMSFIEYLFKNHIFRSFDPIYHILLLFELFYLKCDFCPNPKIMRNSYWFI